MLEQTRMQIAVEDALASAGRRVQLERKLFDLGLLLEEDLRDLCVQVFQKTVRTLDEQLHLICDKESIPWDQGEWEDLKQQILALCGLRVVPYEYDPVDLGFDELAESMYILEHRLLFLDELFLHPDPVGKTFQMILKLKNGDGFTWVDYQFEVTGVSEGTGDRKGFRILKGRGSFPGYAGEASIHITDRGGRLLSVLYQKTYRQPDDPIWQQRKNEPATGYRYELDSQ